MIANYISPPVNLRLNTIIRYEKKERKQVCYILTENVLYGDTFSLGGTKYHVNGLVKLNVFKEPLAVAIVPKDS